jgi:hypothetical protein
MWEVGDEKASGIASQFEPTYCAQYHKHSSLTGKTVCDKSCIQSLQILYRGLAVTSRDDVIVGRPPYWRYFVRAARDVLMEITLENGRK